MKRSILLLASSLLIALSGFSQKEHDKSYVLQVVKNAKLVANIQVGDTIEVSSLKVGRTGRVSEIQPDAIMIDNHRFEIEYIRFIRPSNVTNGFSNGLIAAGSVTAFASITSSVEDSEVKGLMGLGGLGLILIGILTKKKERKKYRRSTGSNYEVIQFPAESISHELDLISENEMTLSDTCQVLSIQWKRGAKTLEHEVRMDEFLTFKSTEDGRVSGTVTDFSSELICVDSKCYPLSEVIYFEYAKPTSIATYLLGSLGIIYIASATSIDREDPNNGFFEEDAEKFAQGFLVAVGTGLIGSAVWVGITSTRVHTKRYDMEYVMLDCQSMHIQSHD